MAHQLIDLVEQFCKYQRNQRGRTEAGARTYRWNLEQYLRFVRAREGRLARLTDLRGPTIQAWMDDMAAADLALNTLRCRQATLSSFCIWLVKRELLPTNPVAPLDRPPHHREPPAQVPGSALMDSLVQAAVARGRPRDVALFALLRFTGMRRASLAALRVRHLDADWGLRGVRVKGGRTQDIPVPPAVIHFLQEYVRRVLAPQVGAVTPDTPLFWSALLGHARIDTTQLYARIRPPELKRAVAFYEDQAQRMLVG